MEEPHVYNVVEVVLAAREGGRRQTKWPQGRRTQSSFQAATWKICLARSHRCKQSGEKSREHAHHVMALWPFMSHYTLLCNPRNHSSPADPTPSRLS